MANQYSTLKASKTSFDGMMKKKFAITTVMNVKVYESIYPTTQKGEKAETILAVYENMVPLCTLDTLKIANITTEGPDKTIMGGQDATPIIKYGKKSRIEIQDALGDSKALAYLGGYVLEWTGTSADIDAGTGLKLHSTTIFHGPRTLIGDSFFIDQETGTEVPVKIIIYNMLPDSVSNLSQEAEGDAAVFDLNGDLLSTYVDIPVFADATTKWVPTRTFYSIIDGELSTEVINTTVSSSNTINMTVDGTFVVTGIFNRTKNMWITSGKNYDVIVAVTETNETVTLTPDNNIAQNDELVIAIGKAPAAAVA